MGVIGLMNTLVVDDLMIGLTIELGFKGEEMDSIFLVLMSKNVFKYGLESGIVECCDDGIGDIPI